MLILTETMFVQAMFNYSPHLFSTEALKLIYNYCSERDTEPTEFREMDIDVSFTEQSYSGCIADEDIPVERLAEASSEFEEIEIMKSAISDFLESNNALVGFTSHHTVVYKRDY